MKKLSRKVVKGKPRNTVTRDITSKDKVATNLMIKPSPPSHPRSNFELYESNKQSSTLNSLMGQLGGTHRLRAHNILPISSSPSTHRNNRKVTPGIMTRNKGTNITTTLKQPSIMDVIVKGKKLLNSIQLTPAEPKK